MSDADEVVKPGKVTTKQVMAMEMKIKRFAVLQVRRFFYGPKCAPSLRAQAKHFVSFGTLVKMEWLASDDRYWN